MAEGSRGGDNGTYQPPVMYDIVLDQFRPVTQKDVDMMQAVVQAYGKLMMAVKKIVEHNNDLRKKLNLDPDSELGGRKL
jgi:hypothetical protein